MQHRLKPDETEALFMNVRGVAIMTGMSETWVKQHATGSRLPKLPAYRMGDNPHRAGALRFKKQEVLEFLDQHCRL